MSSISRNATTHQPESASLAPACRTCGEPTWTSSCPECGAGIPPHRRRVRPARGGQDASIARPGAEMHRNYSQPCDICGRRTSVRWRGKAGAPSYHRHRKCEVRAIELRRASGGAPRSELEADYEPQDFGPIAVQGGEYVYPDHPPVAYEPLDLSGIDVNDIPF